MAGKHVDRHRSGRLLCGGRLWARLADVLFQDGREVPAVGETQLQHLRAVGDAAAGPEQVVAQLAELGAGPAPGAQRGKLFGAQRTGRRDVGASAELPRGAGDRLGGKCRAGSARAKRGEGALSSRRGVAAHNVGGPAHQGRGGSNAAGDLHREPPGPRVASLGPLRDHPRPGRRGSTGVPLGGFSGRWPGRTRVLGPAANSPVRASSRAVRSPLAAGTAAPRSRSRYWRSRCCRPRHAAQRARCFRRRSWAARVNGVAPRRGRRGVRPRYLHTRPPRKCFSRPIARFRGGRRCGASSAAASGPAWRPAAASGRGGQASRGA